MNAAFAMTADVHVPSDHPAFAGHFPSRPLLPGVVILSYVMEALRDNAESAALLCSAPGIEQAKFLAPVGPGSDLRISIQATTDHRPGSSVDMSFDPRTALRLSFQVDSGAGVVAKGVLSAGPA